MCYEVRSVCLFLSLYNHIENVTGAKEYAERQEPIPLNFGTDPQHQEKFSICNYRFIKEFTKEQHSDWVVNVVNHFKPIDRARKYNSL